MSTEPHDLPASWRMALKVCPYCAGTGKRATHLEPESCAFCAGTGDLIGEMLREVYTMGRDEALTAMRALYQDFVRTGSNVATRVVPVEQLKARLGI